MRTGLARRLALPLVLVSILSVPAVALATDLTSAGGFLFDIQDEFGGGELSNGSIDAYDGCYYLDVGGEMYSSPGTGTTTLAGRQVEMGVVRLAGLDVRRIVYVPPASSGNDWARYVEVLENPGARDITTTLRVWGNLGSDGSTVLIATASGDAAVTSADAWFATDDVDGSSDPSLAHLFQSGPGSGAPIDATSASLSFDDIEYTFSVTVPAGGRVAVLHFAIQTMNQAMAQAEARRLLDLPDDAWVGLEEYETDIVNYPPRTILTSCMGARVGARCDDGLFCTRTDRCTAMGTCVGTGTPCDDMNACTVDSCVEATDMCRNEMTPDRCVIGGECVANGVRHPAYPCLFCDPAMNGRDWSMRAPGTACGDSSCTAGRLVPEATCSMTGQCLRGTPERCAVGYCADEDSCATACVEGECPGESFCGPTGACELPRANGSSCAGNAECASDQCVDGICCSEACTETCRSCRVPDAIGTCTDVPELTDPDVECPGGFCDGAGECTTTDGGMLLDAARDRDAGSFGAGSTDAPFLIDVGIGDDAAVGPGPARSSCGCAVPRRAGVPLAPLMGLVLLLARLRARRPIEKRR